MPSWVEQRGCMAEPFLSEIRMMSFGFAPKGWATCDGQLLRSTRTRLCFLCSAPPMAATGASTSDCPICAGACRTIPASGSLPQRERRRAIAYAERRGVAQHTHFAQGSGIPATRKTAQQCARCRCRPLYSDVSGLTTLHPTTITTVVARSPYQHATVSDLLFCIALQGIFPSQN